jgi:hypothetical protein
MENIENKLIADWYVGADEPIETPTINLDNPTKIIIHKGYNPDLNQEYKDPKENKYFRYPTEN